MQIVSLPVCAKCDKVIDKRDGVIFNGNIHQVDGSPELDHPFINGDGPSALHLKCLTALLKSDDPKQLMLPEPAA